MEMSSQSLSNCSVLSPVALVPQTPHTQLSLQPTRWGQMPFARPVGPSSLSPPLPLAEFAPGAPEPPARWHPQPHAGPGARGLWPWQTGRRRFVAPQLLPRCRAGTHPSRRSCGQRSPSPGPSEKRNSPTVKGKMGIPCAPAPLLFSKPSQLCVSRSGSAFCQLPTAEGLVSSPLHHPLLKPLLQLPSDPHPSEVDGETEAGRQTGALPSAVPCSPSPQIQRFRAHRGHIGFDGVGQLETGLVGDQLLQAGALLLLVDNLQTPQLLRAARHLGFELEQKHPHTPRQPGLERRARLRGAAGMLGGVFTAASGHSQPHHGVENSPELP